MSQRDLFDAVAERDRALAQVADNSGGWIEEVLHRIAHLPVGWAGTGEAIRLRLLDDGCERPHHHNAWGAVIRMAVVQGYLVFDNGWAKMTTTKSHARRSPVWRRV